MRILVTGGASGLGAAIVKLLASQAGMEIVFTYASSKAAATDIESQFPAAKGIHCDFNDQASLESFLSAIPDLNIDVLVNNACGPIHKEHFHKTAPEVFVSGFQRNVLSTLRITQQAIKIFRKKKQGKIITILSAAIVNKPPVGWASYVAEKSYLLEMSKVWATEEIRFNITSNCISPSFMQTNMTADMDERIVEQMVDSHPLKKLLTTEEVAEAALYLVHASNHVNGTNMVMNAGM